MSSSELQTMILESHIPIAFCASYINDACRLETLMNMIRSWRDQTVSCPLHLSISVPDKSLRESVEDILTHAEEVYKSEGTGFSFQMHTERKSQFENYKSLVDSFRTATAKQQWIVFSDDDDIWHPERIETYARMCHTINKTHPHIDNIDCAVYAESTNCHTDKMVKNAEFADMMVKCRKAKIVKGINYVTNCVRFERLAFFIDNSTNELLACPFADVKFKAFLTRDGHGDGKQRVIMTPENDAVWMYYYRASEASITGNKLRTPYCVSHSESLRKKWERVTRTMDSDDTNRMKSLINNLTLLICSNFPNEHEHLTRENEKALLDRGLSAKCIVTEYRPLYGILDKFMDDVYFKQLAKSV